MKRSTTVTNWGLILLLLGCSLAACAHSQSDGEAATGVMEGVLGIYRGPLNHLQAVRRGDGCPMHPNCSRYSQEALARFGAVKGWVMTMDRLMRCGRDEIRLAPRVVVDGKLKFYDPVDNNHFGRSSARR